MDDENFEQDAYEEKVDFNEVVDALLDSTTTFPAKYLPRLSGLEGLELEQLAEVWPEILPLRRQRLLEDMELLTDDSFIVNFDEVFKLGLEDENPEVKKTAIRGLWESDEPSVAIAFLEILQSDPNSDVCAQAARGLGKFIYLGELAEIDQKLAEQINQILIKAATGDEPEIVRLYAVESLGFSSRPEATTVIEEAYNKQKEDWLVSALIAMGRSANNQWIPQIIENLSHEEPQIRMEAAQSAGLLGSQQAVPHLLQLIDDPEVEVKLAAIWALSEVGGMDARAALEGLLKKSQDENEIDFLEDALENIDFNELNLDFELFDISPEEAEDPFDDNDWDEED